MRRARWSDVGHVVADGAVLAATARIAGDGLPESERELFARLASLPRSAERLLWLPMQFGSLWGPVVTAALVWRRTRDTRLASGTLVSGIAAWQAAKLVKARVRRGRPAAYLTDTAPRRGTPSDGLGFPSGHSAVAFAVVAVLRPRCGIRGRVALDALAVVVGLARIDVAAHLPLDVVGGAALGDLIGSTWNVATAPRDHSTPGPDGGRAGDEAVRAGSGSSRWSRSPGPVRSRR